MSRDPREPFGDVHDPAWTSGAGSMIGLLKRIASLLASGFTIADTTKVHIWDGTDELLISASGEALVRLNTSAITLPVSLATLPALVAGTANIGDVDVLTVPADPFGADADAASVTGSISAKLRSLATNLAAVVAGSELQVDIVSIAAGNNNIGDVDIASGTLTTVTTVTTVTTLTGGGIAHDSPDSGNPHKLGMKAIDIGTQPTAVTNNDRTDWYANRNGVPWVLGGSPAVLTKELDVTDADGAQTDAALVSVSSGTAIVVTAIQVTADGANTGDVGFRIGFGTANTPAADAAGIVCSHPGVKAGSGVVVGNGGGVIGMGASDQDLRLTCEDPAGGAIRVVVTYFTILIG